MTTKFKHLNLLVGLLLLTGCTTPRNYTHYLLDAPVQRNEALKEDGKPLQAYSAGSTTALKVRWNDGKVLTEVDVPMLASSQRVIIEHSADNQKVKVLPTSRLVPPPPGPADKSLSEAYRERGLKVNESAPDVSVSRSRSLMQEAIRNANYSLALEYAELVLARYPSHPEFLRAKGSILLLMGEREKAIETWEKSEEIESDSSVRKKLEDLRKNKK
ncbi:hypothetical protein EBR21_13655 [bacterium]|nr:hypothetical protein [bacterium]